MTERSYITLWVSGGLRNKRQQFCWNLFSNCGKRQTNNEKVEEALDTLAKWLRIDQPSTSQVEFLTDPQFLISFSW